MRVNAGKRLSGVYNADMVQESLCMCLERKEKTHVFIAKHQNSKIVCVDPQTGDRVNIDRRLNLTVKGMTEISRIDNLKPSKYINGCVRRRKDDKQKNDQNSSNRSRKKN